MPSDTRYVRAATARRSPNARLYSAVPRSSQWPSIVTAQLGYFLSTDALASSAAWPFASTSALSYSKKTGWSGELRFRSSSDAEAMRSSRAGSGGTTVGSAAGSGGAGGRCAGAVVAGGGGIGRATGGVFLPHPANITIERTNRAASVVNRGANRMHIASAPWYAVCRADRVREVLILTNRADSCCPNA